MEKKPTTTERAKPRRAPYRQPKLRDYGSIQSITQSKFVYSSRYDGAGGGGKTRVHD
jgi:hypothetical protein